MAINYLSNCPCVEAMDNITGKVFVRLSYEYGLCSIKRELIPTFGMVCLKTVIANLNSIRKLDEMAVYIDLFDIITLGLVELNFESTEKATNILPDFRLGKYGCKLLSIDYDKYNKHQAPLNKFSGKIIDVESYEQFWKDLAYKISNSMYRVSEYLIDNQQVIKIFFKTFLEEVFYEISDHRKEKEYSYKLYDLLMFENYGDIISVDALPEYKLMVKDDSFIEDRIYEELDKNEKSYKEKNTLYS